MCSLVFILHKKNIYIYSPNQASVMLATSCHCSKQVYKTIPFPGAVDDRNKLFNVTQIRVRSLLANTFMSNNKVNRRKHVNT